MKWLGRVAAATVVRRLTLLLLAALLAALGVNSARAADANCTSLTAESGACDNREQAAQRAIAAANYKAPAQYAGTGCIRLTVIAHGPTISRLYAGSGPGCDINGTQRDWPRNQDCPAGTTWDAASNTCKPPNDCASKPPINGAGMKSPGCFEGCEYFPATNARRLDAANADSITFAETWGASGAQCSTPTPKKPYDPQKPVCFTPQGASYSECVHPDGKHCITSARGTRMCWAPGETGDRNSADGKDGANRTVAPTTPTIPSVVANPTPAGPTTNTTINNTTYNTSSATGSGSTGGTQGNTGTGGTDAGAGGDGGEGEDQEGPGTAAAPLADPYEGSEETVADVFADYKGRVSTTPMGNAITTFFTVSVGGSCPSWSVPASEWWPTMVFDYHCTGILANTLSLVGYVLLAVVAYKAFQIAVY